MAFSKHLEEIIEAALADGMITDKERAVLHKKAQMEGVDPDEVDVVIDGRLAKMKREVDWLKPEPPRSVRRGNLAKCPSCGSPYVPGTGRCPECGHVYQNIEANSTTQMFSNKILEITNSYRGKSAEELNVAPGDINEPMKQEIRHFITTFPIPTTKDDMIEFISVMEAGRHAGTAYSKAYSQKFKECRTKARTVFPNDKEIENALACTRNLSIAELFVNSWMEIKPVTRMMMILFIMLPILMCLLTLFMDSYQ